MRKKNRKCSRCGVVVNGFFFNGKRVGIVAIYGGKDEKGKDIIYCSRRCYNESL